MRHESYLISPTSFMSLFWYFLCLTRFHLEEASLRALKDANSEVSQCTHHSTRKSLFINTDFTSNFPKVKNDIKATFKSLQKSSLLPYLSIYSIKINLLSSQRTRNFYISCIRRKELLYLKLCSNLSHTQKAMNAMVNAKPTTNIKLSPENFKVVADHTFKMIHVKLLGEKMAT